MMIFNWPDGCPKCRKACGVSMRESVEEATKDKYTEEQLKELSEKGYNFVPVELDPKQFDKPIPEGAQAFHCKDCDSVWVEVLIKDDKFPTWIVVAETFWYEPLAILCPNPAHVRRLFDISKTVNHTVIKLEAAFRAGEERIKHVQSPEGNKKLWIPAPGSAVDLRGPKPPKR